MITLSQLFSSFRHDQRGTIAMIFALVIVILVGGVGLAVDYGRSFNVATKLRAAADAAALAGAKLLDEGVSDAHIKDVADKYFQTQLGLLGIGKVSTTPLVVTIDRAASTVEVDADVSVGTTFAQIVSVPSLDFDVSSKVEYRIRKVELAMVVDVTGSMNSNGRLSALKTAAGNIIDTLVNPTVGKHNRISVVPYSASVNVGNAYRNIASGGDSLDGCVMERMFPANRDTDEVAGHPNNYAVDGQLNSAATGRYNCPNAELAPLSKDAASLKSTINSYAASGWTAGHIGLAWGWNTLSPKWDTVFTGDAAPGPYGDDNIIKAIILLTDGAFNTSYSGGESEADQKTESEARTNALCTAMKAENIRIYTVAFEAPSDAQVLLQGCASAPANYFNATDSVQLNAAFQTIADNLRSMRVSQ